MTLKSSTIFIAVGKRTRIYQSMDQVPDALRRRLEESTNSVNSATILIADKRGRQEIVKALRGLPSELRSRLTSSLSATRVRRNATPAKPAAESGLLAVKDDADSFVRRYWVEFAVPTGVGFLIWLTLHFVGR